MSTRWYPLYQRGNPQLRVYLPNFWMKIMRPSTKLPKNVVHFTVSTEMTEFDVKNYLEKIYQVPVAHVRVEMKNGDVKIMSTRLDKAPDYKVAYVTMARTEEFEFPNFSTNLDGEFKKINEPLLKAEKPFNDKAKKTPWQPAWFL